MEVDTPPKKTSTRKKLKSKKKSKSIISVTQTGKFDSSESTEITNQNIGNQKVTPSKSIISESIEMEKIGEKYPVLKDESLIQKFLSVPMNNNQKGRVRQLLKDKLKGTSDVLLPDVIYHRIQVILKSAANLTDTDLRKIRILYNMLKTTVQNEHNAIEKVEDKTTNQNENNMEIERKVEKKKITAEDEEKIEGKKEKKEIKEKKEPGKKKGKKRYVVFLGNLPVDIDKGKIHEHFSDLSDHIIDVRIPKRAEGKKSAIAYLELSTEPSYELALSKHHSMLCNRRINVLYSMQKDGKITKSEAKSKSAKLVALQKSGRLIGSVPLNRKRSHRRMKLKQARAREEQNNS